MKFWQRLKANLFSRRAAPSAVRQSVLEPVVLQNLVRSVKQTRPVELSCDECFEQLDRFAELHLAGKAPREALPLVQEHLDACGNCREEFEALLRSLQTLDQPPRDSAA